MMRLNMFENFVDNIVKKVINEIYKRPINGVLELGPRAVSKKKKYAKPLWRIIQNAYAYMGGCQSFDKNGDDGFNDFLYGDYIWRVFFGETSQDIMGITVYKHTNFGRKKVCSCAINREIYNELINYDMQKSNHSYTEVSGKTENILLKDKRTNWINKNEVPNILRKDVDLEQDTEADKAERIPYDSQRHYYRDIGGTKHRKAMFGHPIKR